MTVSRRAATAGLAASLAAVLLSEINAPIAEAAEGTRDWWPDHPLFASNRIPGALWTRKTLPVDDISEELAEIKAEIHAALLEEGIATAENGWLTDLRTSLRPAARIYEPSRGWAFEADERETLASNLLRAAPASANTAVVSPSMATFLQIQRGGYEHHREPEREGTTLIRMGTLGGLRVFADPYAADDQPALVGFVHPQADKRHAALQRVGLSGVEFGTRPGHDDPRNWALVGIEMANIITI